MKSPAEKSAAARLEQLEELAIDVGISGPWEAADDLTSCLAGLRQDLAAIARQELAASVAAGTEELVRKVVAREVLLPSGFTERLLETISALQSALVGQDATGRLEELLAGLGASRPDGQAEQPPPPAVDVISMFVSEAAGCLDRVEQGLLELEGDRDRGEASRKIARALHNLKGSAGMAGQERIVELAHRMESEALQCVSHPENAAVTRLVDGLLSGLDAVRAELAALAGAARTHSAPEPERQLPSGYLVFWAGGCRMALPVRELVRVDRLPPYCPVPFTPPSVMGLAQIAGELLPLVDLAVRLGLQGEGSGDWVLVVASGAGKVALRVERVGELCSVPDSELLGSVDPPASEFASDALRLDGQVPLLSIPRLFETAAAVAPQGAPQ